MYGLKILKLEYFLGINITKYDTEDCIHLSSKTYIDRAYEKFENLIKDKQNYSIPDQGC